MRLELVETKVLCAVRFFDTTTELPVRSPLVVTGDGLRVARNRQGLYVLVEAPEAPTAELTVSDPTGRYLPRRLVLSPPQSSLFLPLDARLCPSPAATAAPGSAVIRATVRDGDGKPLGGVLLRVMRAGVAKPVAYALTDWREPVKGEALVAVPGKQFLSWTQSDEVLVSLEAFFDPAGPWPPDPDDLESRPMSAQVSLALTSGCIEKVALTVG
jgi:hypothetical protein